MRWSGEGEEQDELAWVLERKSERMQGNFEN